MPVIPFIPMIASGIMGAVQAHRESSQASDAAGMEKSLLDRQSALANTMTNFGQGQISASKPALDKAMQYYMTLAGGNRGQMNSLLGPERSAINDTSRGIQRGLEAHMGPGAQRDQAMADISRQKQGQLGLLPMTARNDAVGKLADLGGNAANRGMSAMTGAAGALGGQTAGIGQMFGIQQQGQNAWNQFGSDMFKTYGPWLMGMKGAGKQQGPWAGGYQF